MATVARNHASYNIRSPVKMNHSKTLEDNN